MDEERQIWFTDRYGITLEDDTTLEVFAALFDALADNEADVEHSVVAIDDSNGWNVEFSIDKAFLGEVERGGEELGELPLASREQALAIAQAFIDGDFATLRKMSWQRH